MKKKIIWAIVIFFTFLIIAISFLVTQRVSVGIDEIIRHDKAEPIYNRAEKFIEDGRYDEAEEALFAIVDKYPDSIYTERALRKLGLILIKTGDYKRARDVYRHLLSILPDVRDSSEVRSIIEGLNIKVIFSPVITEDSIEYEVQKGDTLFSIAKKFNTTVELLKKINNLQKDLIRPSQKLKIIVSEFSLLIDKSSNVLVLREDKEVVKTYSVSTGKNNSTPVGVFKIEEKLVKPLWYKVGSVVSPDSEEYELGARWMGLSIEGYGIHGTADENSIGKQVTEGCVRMHNDDVIELFTILPSGTEVMIVD